MTTPTMSETATTADAKPPLLSVQNLSAGYPTPRGVLGRTEMVPIIHDVSFDIQRGETLAIVGESGSGKSTTGRAILRLLPTISGSILFQGNDITRWGKNTPLQYRKSVQAIFQDPAASLNPRHLISQILRMPLWRHGVKGRSEAQHKMEWAMERVGLNRSMLNRFANELSGGQQQRVAIARALLLDPQLVVCDEAVSALDLSTQGQIINLLADLQEETGASYFFITHDLGIVRHIADRVGVMDRGRLVELNDTESVLNKPEHAFTKRLIDATPAVSPAGRAERRRQRQQKRKNCLTGA